jgi:hypothetical protein
MQSRSCKIHLQHPPQKVKAVMSFWERMILHLTDLDMMIYNNLPNNERALLDMERKQLRRLITRCSRLKLSVNRNIIFQ